MRRRFFIAAAAFTLPASMACSPLEVAAPVASTCPSGTVVASSEKALADAELRSMASIAPLATFTIAGTVQYERFVPATTPPAMNYGVVVTSPIRRAIVQIMSGATAIATGVSDDSGAYSIAVSAAAGASIFVRVQARSAVSAYAKDGLGGAAAENCAGGSWDVQVVNNVTNNSCTSTTPSARPLYVLDGSEFAAPASGTTTKNMTASTTFTGGAYTNRSGAPFALLDTAISGLETACQGRAAIAFPELYINWSVNNTNTSGNRYAGNISTSFFTTESSSSIANLYILGKAGTDTDEFDRHVVAHEFGHFLENKIYRSDSVGGSHSLTDSLDPRLAFGEGFGNAFSGIVHADPVYVDTSGSAQASGFKIDVSTAPATTDDRGPWSEASMQYMLYHFWATRNSFDRIHNILENFQKTSAALTNGLTFVSYYAQEYGVANGPGDDLTATWTGAATLDSPLNALCSGACAGTYEQWDTDNDLGTYFATGGGGQRRYKQGVSGTSFTAPFWQMYRTLASGANAATAHDQISFGGYALTSSNLNKFGLHRFYKLTATASTTTVSVSSITQGTKTCSNDDLLDMAVYYKGTRVGLDEAVSGPTASCPSVTFSSTIGQIYVIDVLGFGTVGAYTISVSP